MALLCNVGDFFYPTAASAFKSFIKNSLRLCQLAVLPHRWLLQICPFCLDFHSIQAKRVRVRHFLDNFAFMLSCACIVGRFRYKGLLHTKDFLYTVKALIKGLVGCLLNKKCSRPGWGNIRRKNVGTRHVVEWKRSSVILSLKIRDRDGT